MGNLYGFVEQISKGNRGTATTQEKEMLPQICQTQDSVVYAFQIVPKPKQNMHCTHRERKKGKDQATHQESHTHCLMH